MYRCINLCINCFMNFEKHFSSFNKISIVIYYEYVVKAPVCILLVFVIFHSFTFLSVTCTYIIWSLVFCILSTIDLRWLVLFGRHHDNSFSLPMKTLDY